MLGIRLTDKRLATASAYANSSPWTSPVSALHMLLFGARRVNTGLVDCEKFADQTDVSWVFGGDYDR